MVAAVVVTLNVAWREEGVAAAAAGGRRMRFLERGPGFAVSGGGEGRGGAACGSAAPRQPLFAAAAGVATWRKPHARAQGMRGILRQIACGAHRHDLLRTPAHL
ncbi:Protein of unknown function [Gryllus bimaculatus]|nr:Protein of unknown function [Gryllus bimaculatus]